jgi:hypothetical protein
MKAGGRANARLPSRVLRLIRGRSPQRPPFPLNALSSLSPRSPTFKTGCLEETRRGTYSVLYLVCPAKSPPTKSPVQTIGLKVTALMISALCFHYFCFPRVFPHKNATQELFKYLCVPSSSLKYLRLPSMHMKTIPRSGPFQNRVYRGDATRTQLGSSSSARPNKYIKL